MRTITATLAVLLSVVASTPSARASSTCIMTEADHDPPLAGSAKGAKVVFSGEVTGVRRDDVVDGSACASLGLGGCPVADVFTYEVRIDRVWKGRAGKTTKLVILEGH